MNTLTVVRLQFLALADSECQTWITSEGVILEERSDKTEAKASLLLGDGDKVILIGWTKDSRGKKTTRVAMVRAINPEDYRSAFRAVTDDENARLMTTSWYNRTPEP